MDHPYQTRIRHNITIKPAARRRQDNPDEDYPDFPPPNVVLHPDDAASKVFLAVARAFVSVDNRAMTIKDIADRASRYGLVCQNLSAAAQAVTTYLRQHKTRCDQQDDHPLLLSHTLSGTPADDDLVAALYSRSGGDSHPVSENRLTNFRKGTAVWYLSRATGVPCPFTRAGIRLCDYVTVDSLQDSQQLHQNNSINRRTRTQELDEEGECGQKRKRPLRGCVAKHNTSDNERPPKIKLTLRLKPLLARTTPNEPPFSAAGSTPVDPIDVTKEHSDSYDSDDEQEMPVDSSDDESPPNPQQEEPWSLPPYPRRSISIPCYTPSATSFSTYPLPPSKYRDPFRRSPSVSFSATPPPESEDEADDFHVTMTRIEQEEDDLDLGWEADLDSEGDEETMWESPGPRSPSAPLILPPSQVAVKQEPRDVQGMLDAWEGFDSSIAETRAAEVWAKVFDAAPVDQVKVEGADIWNWEADSAGWPSAEDIKQEDFAADSFLPGPSSPLSPISSLSSQFSSFSWSDTPPHDDSEDNNAASRPRSQTVPSPFSTTANPPLLRHSLSSESSKLASRDPNLGVPPQQPCVSPLQTRCVPSPSTGSPAPKVIVHTCQPCNPAITATHMEDISVFQMMLGAFQLLRRIDSDFVNLSPIIAYSGTAGITTASSTDEAQSGDASPCSSTSSSGSQNSNVVTNATVITSGSPEICGTWVTLAAAQAYVRDHLPGESARALEVFLSDALAERFPSALQDFKRSNAGLRALNQFGKHFASTLIVAGGLGVLDCAVAIPAGGLNEVKEAESTRMVPGLNVLLPTPGFVLGLGSVEDGNEPLSKTEQEIFHELCVIPPDWDNKEDGMAVDEAAPVEEQMPETPTTAKCVPPAKRPTHAKNASVSSISSLSSDSDTIAHSTSTIVPKGRGATAPTLTQPLRRSKRVASALANTQNVPQQAARTGRSRKAGSRNSLS